MKTIINVKLLCIYLKNSFISLFSFFLIKIISKKNISKLINSLKNKKVFVLGTGPSLDQLNQEMIDRYDVIVFLNNSINVVKIFNFDKKIKIFFNSDLFRFKQLKDQILSLNKDWIYIFIPIHLQLIFNFIKFYFEKEVYLLVPKYKIGSPFEKNVTKSLITYLLAKNSDTKKFLDIDNFKAFPHTVALNAFYFLISCKVSKIHYLGCDFTSGNSSSAKDQHKSNFTNKKIYLWINRLKKLSDTNQINFKDLKL